MVNESVWLAIRYRLLCGVSSLLLYILNLVASSALQLRFYFKFNL